MSTHIGNYRVIREIGKGGCATTYLAEHILLGEKACLKQNLLLTPEETELLKKEAKLLWHIHHHSLPTLRDFIRYEDGSYVLVMTYIEGLDLYKIITEKYPKGIDPEHVCWMMQRLLNALHYLHFHGIIHGDVKPHNILIKPDEHNAVLVDYGLSTINPGRRTKCPGCTPAFAAPEQLEGRPPIPETDMYGLGASMIFALGGNYIGLTYPECVPAKLQRFINQLLLHDPLRRPSKAESLIGPLSDLRKELFGRRTSEKEFKI